MTPTEEQLAIVAATVETEDNLLISALAGAAKTSTLVLIAQALPKVQIQCLAFNKKIATEMQSRLPDNCKASTLNSVGHRAWGDAIGKRLRIEDKVYPIMSGLIKGVEDPELQKLAYEKMSDLMKIVSQGKTAGYIPDHHFPNAKRLLNDDEFFGGLDDILEEWEIDLVREASIISIKQAFEGLLDYDDQLLMPTVFSAPFPFFPVILVDETQDLSVLNHVMLTKMSRRLLTVGKKSRLIAVGDECQAIYGFRGAHEESMALLEETFGMRRMILSISFRCPIKVVEEARWRAPHMRWPEWAKPGEVKRLPEWTHSEIPENAAIICRNNAPLFSMAIKLLKHGRYPQLMGNDIGKGLLKIMKKFGPLDMPQDMVFQKIAEWEEEKLEKTRAEGSVRDRADCMRVFAGEAQDLRGAMAYAEHIFNTQGSIKLMTGHKAKGLEFDDVFFLDEFILKKEGQDRNLRYVIQTRAKSTLTYIKSENFIDEKS
jgi:DNA helicase-2/ATP-dependent DNA helicase PcrA